MTGTRKRDGDSEGDSGFVTPDSTSQEKTPRFVEGEDVLSHGKDGIFYLGTVVEVDTDNERCLVQFEDSTAHWSLYKDISKLKVPLSDDLCVICKSSKSCDTNEIVLCSICEQGYHQNCLRPRIKSEFCLPESIWECPHCSGNTVLEKEEKRKSRENSPRKQRPKPQSQEPSQTKLPYDLNSLTWTKHHKSNQEETYCYCGGPGEWYNRMLQCGRCQQWFHEACIESLNFPLLYGDRFFVFVCSLCNKGMEFIHRLDVRWVDIVHLALFNLTIQEGKKFFDIEKNIVAWINDNWEFFQVPLSIQKSKVSDRKKEVTKQLQVNRPRFKCSKENKKKVMMWCLRIKVPPPAPVAHLPLTGVVTELTIKQSQFFSKPNTRLDSPPLPHDCIVKDKPNTNGNKFSPAKKHPISPVSLDVLSCGEEEQSEEDTEDRGYEEEDESYTESIGRPTKQLPSLPKRKTRAIEVDYSDKKLRITNMEFSTIKTVNNYHKDIKTSPEPIQPSLKRRRGRPPKTSENGVAIDLRDINKKPAQRKLKEALKKTKGNRNRPATFTPTSGTPGDTSGDETSSHGTLDSFIPPPSNFEGSNNPFLNLDSLSYGMPVIRPLKRKLNESDIRIDKNGDVKRRKFRRKYDKGKFILMLQSCDQNGLEGTNKTNEFNIGTNNSIKNCVDYALSARLGSIKDEVKTECKLGETSLFSDLKSTVCDYFGAATRIANGEKFHILAKRLTNDCKVQYLIEWDSPVSS